MKKLNKIAYSLALLAIISLPACSKPSKPEVSPTTEMIGIDLSEGFESSTGDSDPSGYLIIEPTNTVIEIDLGQPVSLPYQVWFYPAGGDPEEVTDEVTFELSNTMLGQMQGAKFVADEQWNKGAHSTYLTTSFAGEEATASLTIVAYEMDGSKADFFFVLPEKGDGQSKPLKFQTEIRKLDVMFAMDTTGSMLEEIHNLQISLTEPQNGIIKRTAEVVPDSQFGLGSIEDFPIPPYGSHDDPNDLNNYCAAGMDQPFELLQNITADQNALQEAAKLFQKVIDGEVKPSGCGGDAPESHLEALYQIATGEGLSGPGKTFVAPYQGPGRGGVGFREGSMPIIVPITDVYSHDRQVEIESCINHDFYIIYEEPVASVAHSRSQTKAALDNLCAKVVGVASGSLGGECTSLTELLDFANHSGAKVPPQAWGPEGVRPGKCLLGECCTAIEGSGTPVDSKGLCPLVFQTDQKGAGLGEHITSGIQMLARYAPFTVTVEIEGMPSDIFGNPLPAGKTSADFITSVVPHSFTAPADLPADMPIPTTIHPQEQYFQDVIPGSTLFFDVNVKNDVVAPKGEPQVFEANIRILAGGCTDLDERKVFIVIPAKSVIVG